MLRLKLGHSSSTNSIAHNRSSRKAFACENVMATAPPRVTLKVGGLRCRKMDIGLDFVAIQVRKRPSIFVRRGLAGLRIAGAIGQSSSSSRTECSRPEASAKVILFLWYGNEHDGDTIGFDIPELSLSLAQPARSPLFKNINRPLDVSRHR